MVTAPALRFTETPQTYIDDLLFRICVELQLDETRRKLAEASYRSVGALLESQPAIAALRPTIYAQGSIRLDTTVKPLAGDEFDLDVVCEFAAPHDILCEAG